MALKNILSHIDLRDIFLGLQSQMVEQFKSAKKLIKHPVSKGDAIELQWLKLLGDYLPQRYCAARAFVLDCKGNLSDQIDIVIYDRQYSPLMFNQSGTKYVPAESVYAVFEVRPQLNRQNFAYAGAKAASVRRLQRTSAPIPYAAGVYKPKIPPKILAGILALQSGWTPSYLEKGVTSILAKLPTEARLDLGCALQHGSFDASYSDSALTLQVSHPVSSLIFFFLRLLARLQALGTVAALDFTEYSQVL